MKKKVLVFLVSIVAFQASSQAQTIMYERIAKECGYEDYLLFNHEENNFKILVEGAICEDVQIEVDSGHVSQENCTYSIRPNVHNFRWEYPIKVKAKGKFIDTINLMVSSGPSPIFYFRSRSFHYQPHYEVYLDSIEGYNCIKQEKPTIDSFYFVIRRKDHVIYKDMVKGNKFEAHERAKILSLATNHDEIKVLGVYYKIGQRALVDRNDPIHFRLFEGLILK